VHSPCKQKRLCLRASKGMTVPWLCTQTCLPVQLQESNFYQLSSPAHHHLATTLPTFLNASETPKKPQNCSLLHLWSSWWLPKAPFAARWLLQLRASAAIPGGVASQPLHLGNSPIFQFSNFARGQGIRLLHEAVSSAYDSRQQEIQARSVNVFSTA
jgi:hypothetical protein